jgi:hypothetical protein
MILFLVNSTYALGMPYLFSVQAPHINLGLFQTTTMSRNHL